MNLYQLYNRDGDEAGLYLSRNNDDLSIIQKVFDDAFESSRDEDDVQDAVDELLEEQGIERVFVDEITTNVI